MKNENSKKEIEVGELKNMPGNVSIDTIRSVLTRLGGYGSVFIPEYTYNGLRIDGLILDTTTRWIRGFEIKMSRSDYLRDEKWHKYSLFCSSLSLVCPWGLIDKKEIPDPFGLLWIKEEHHIQWMKKPRNFQKRGGLSWTYTYLEVLEYELPRMFGEINTLRAEVEYLQKNRRNDLEI